MVDSQTREILEFTHIFSVVLGYCRSPEGRKRLEKQAFITSAEKILEIQQESKQIQEFVVKGEYPFRQYPEISLAIQNASVENVILDPEDCCAIAAYIESAYMESQFLLENLPPGSLLKSIRETSIPFELVKTVRKYFSSQGEFLADSIPALQAINKRISQAQQRARNEAYSFLQNGMYSSFWTSQEPALRDGRLVLPLQENFRGRIDGIVHTRSSSGNTLFLEPQELLQANNQISVYRLEYDREVRRIMKEISDCIVQNHEAIVQTQFLVGWIDDRCARARYVFEQQCIWLPVQPASGPAKLVQARHPLLGKKAVPLTIEISGDPDHIMILSGPNTGGKTVALKTFGICSLLHQYGLPVPVADGSFLPLFSGIYADVGDTQSLEQALSTFSGHISRLNTVLGQLDRHALVLLDELGTGTDPQEAGVLAVAICEYLQKTACKGIVTTHLWEVKKMAEENDYFLNAAMSFDEQNHRPQFSIVPGLPGSSRALDTAEIVGLPAEIIMRARQLFSEGQSDSSRLLQNLADKKQELKKQRMDLEYEKKQSSQYMHSLLERERDLVEREHQVRKGRLQEADALLSDARSRVERIIRSIQEEKQKISDIKNVRAELDEIARTVDEKRQAGKQALRFLQDLHEEDQEINRPFEIGDQIRLRESEKTGEIVRSAGKNSWLVRIGSIRMKVAEQDIRHLGAAKTKEAKKEPKSSSVFASGGLQLNESSWQIDVRGLRSYQAEQEVQRLLDSALVQGSSQVVIIHGKGTGALQQTIHTYLQGHPAVKEIRFARPEFGGSGKTEVLLQD